MTRQRRHNWVPGEGGKVKCSRCGVEVSKDRARRGVGACEGKHKAQLSQTSRTPPSPPIIELGNCGACGQPLKQVPFNSRMDMIACVNRRCEIYRERLRFVPAMATKKRIKQLKSLQEA